MNPFFVALAAEEDFAHARLEQALLLLLLTEAAEISGAACRSARPLCRVVVRTVLHRSIRIAEHLGDLLVVKVSQSPSWTRWQGVGLKIAFDRAIEDVLVEKGIKRLELEHRGESDLLRGFRGASLGLS
ncbi:hypothetical protein F2981_21840 (plasmid) [Sinorhizobium meliloti]|nr:hypothetical protein [Sinorhizobium meliloti]